MRYIPLTKENIGKFIGKAIAFTAEGYGKSYYGEAIIESVDFSKHNPINAKWISGDDIKYAFLDNHGLVTNNDGESYQMCKDCTCFSYSDRGREVFVVAL